MVSVSLCLTLCLLVAATSGASTGDFFTPCSLKDPEIESCMLTQAKEMWPKIVPGVRAWGLIPLDPIEVTQMTLSNGGNQAINLELSGNNLKFTGYKDIQIQSVKADVDKLHFEFLLTIPEYRVQGQYHMKGQLLVLPIVGDGDMDVYYYQQMSNVSFDFTRAEEGGKKILKLQDVTYKIPDIARAKIHFGNLFGNKQLSDNMNNVLNNNWRAMFNELNWRVERSLSELFYSLFEPMFKHISITDLFKDVD